MHATLPLLEKTDFPPIHRSKLEILQVNLGYFCNQSCLHCHVNAGPKRTEMMSAETAAQVIEFLINSDVHTLDLTGGAPELHEQFKPLITAGLKKGCRIIDRCNLTVLFEDGQEDLADYLAHNQIDIVASLPCYLEENVDAQRGKGVFEKSITALKRLNALGYGQKGSPLTLDLVFNPQGPVLPPAQEGLQEDYKKFLNDTFGIHFSTLLVLANLPIKRFGSTLISKGEFYHYIELLKSSHNPSNVGSVMCRNTISVDYQGYVYDCDFNQMLDLPIGGQKQHISTLHSFDQGVISIADHCFACTAGQGSSCGGALS